MTYHSGTRKLEGLKNAWLSPTGRLVVSDREFDGRENGWHESLACCIIRDLENLSTASHADSILRNTDCIYAHEYLEEKKWIRLQGFGGIKPRWIVADWQRITKAQEAVIVDWCEVNNRNCTDAFAENG